VLRQVRLGCRLKLFKAVPGMSLNPIWFETAFGLLTMRREEGPWFRPYPEEPPSAASRRRGFWRKGLAEDRQKSLLTPRPC
jgi:hypothetical protein